MNNYCHDLELGEKLLNDSLLFSSIRKNKTPEEKIKKIKKYLDRGANINATDANNKNNTPLHVAVMKEEPEVVSFLLEQGALIDSKNHDNQTAVDVARLLDKFSTKRKGIGKIMESFNNHNLTQASCQQGQLTNEDHLNSTKTIEKLKNLQPDTYDAENQTQSQVVNRSTLVKNIKLEQSKSKQQKLGKQLKKTDESKIFLYQKRTGTSALSGQLYETKLLSLILFRAIYVYKVQHFLIATNVESMGAFDDIVFRFSSSKGDKSKIMFVQAKHRDNPAKDKFTVDEIMKSNGDFSLQKYLESYIKISQMFVPDNSDEMFRGEFKNMDCEFVIYTSAIEKFSKMQEVSTSLTDGKRFINTSEGKVFQFDYEDQDVELLVQTVAKSRAMLLAKRLSKFILQNNHSNMMMDDLIKTYHVFLARDILAIQITDGESQNNFHYAKFRESLFTRDDELTLAFKNTICQEKKKTISAEELTEIENTLKSSSFKVPVDFGNLNFCFSGSEKEKEKELEYLCSKFKQLFANAKIAENIVMKVDDNMIGPNEILQSTDLETCRLGGLVGNLLVLDDETKTLKFNSNINTFSVDNLKLYEKLKNDVYSEIDVSKCRFDINVHSFPRLSLIHDEYDKNLISDFLGKLIFYTNQATEDKVEKILKKEIDTHFVRCIPRQNDALFTVKGDAIFLIVHDLVQKWWKQPNNAPYLTESCEFFFGAEQDILNSPLLSILNFTYIKTIKNALPTLKFKNTALELLHFDDYFAGAVRILSIISEENPLSSIKLIQHLKEQNINDYTFIDLDYVGIGNYFVDVKTEVKESKIKTLIVVCKSQDLVAEISLLIKHFCGKIIIICNRHLANQINELTNEDIVERVDSQTEFNDLADDMRTILLEKRYIMFQGKEVPLGILFEDKSYDLINSNVLFKIINNEKIVIGNCFNNPAYDEMSDVYMNARVCRFITFDINVQESDSIQILKYSELAADFTSDARDIVLITDRDEEFADFIDKHKKCNVHWFTCYEEWLVWKKSRGNLVNILKHVNRGAHSEFILKPVTLKDLREKVVIISGEPGMGKSALLTHLAINTKHDHPALWISKINLLENTDELRRLKDNKVIIDLKEAVQFLFRVIGFKAYKQRREDFEIIIDEVSVVSDNISLNKNVGEMNLTGSNLFEIELFIHCYNNDRVVLLFDGFDEICPDFANEFMQLVNVLKKSKVLHLWITSRVYNVLHQLENTLETFSFTIQPLIRSDQIDFLRQMLLKKFGANKLDSYTLGLTNDSVWEFHNAIHLLLTQDAYELLTVPLHLYMISEFFQDSFFNNSFNSYFVNLSEIYERFIDIKFFKIRFGEKKPLLCIDDPDMRKLIDNERTGFFYIHKILAAHVIFGQSDEIQLFDHHEINVSRDFIEKIKVGEEKTGIIEQIIENKPKFFQYTFVEYFAAEFLYDKLKSFHYKSSLWKYLIELFLQSERDRLLGFFNAKLGKYQLFFHKIKSAELNEMFGTLLLERKKLAQTLFKVIGDKFENIAIILLRIVGTVLNQNNLNFFIDIINSSFYKRCCFCSLVSNDAKDAIAVIIELVKNIDAKRLIDLFNCSDLPESNPLVDSDGLRSALYEDADLLDVLLSDLSAADLVNLYCQSFTLRKRFKVFEPDTAEKKIIHLFMKEGKLDSKWFDKTLVKLNREQLMTIFSARDDENRSVAHEAATFGYFEFFEKLNSVLDRSQFIELCMARDDFGVNPFNYFPEDNNFEKLKHLLGDVYESDTN